jgi:hypothetical protein
MVYKKNTEDVPFNCILDMTFYFLNFLIKSNQLRLSLKQLSHKIFH